MKAKDKRDLATRWTICSLSVLQFCQREIDLAVRRARREERKRKLVYVYVDERTKGMP